MTLEEARQECYRWFAYLARQEERTRKVQEAAAMSRSGNVEEGKRMLRNIDRSTVTVYDGAHLRDAVEVLLKVTKDM